MERELSERFSNQTFFPPSIPGLEAELFYVRDGVVNKYAMMFVVPVNASIYDLEFSWQRLTAHPVSDSSSIAKGQM